MVILLQLKLLVKHAEYFLSVTHMLHGKFCPCRIVENPLEENIASCLSPVVSGSP